MEKGVVMERLDERSYDVETMDGSSYRRNRAHLKQTNGLPTELPESPPKQAAQEPPKASSNSDENMDLTEKISHLEPCEETAEYPPALTTRTRSGQIVKKPARFKDYVT